MGFHTRQPDHAGACHGAGRRHDRREPPPRLRRGSGRADRLILFVILVAAGLGFCQLRAETIRVATLDAELSRKGPGLMLRDIRRRDPQVLALAELVNTLKPDILFLQGVDYDLDLIGLRALRDAIAAEGFMLPHVFALRPNRGQRTGIDMNGDGRSDSPEDAQGFGRFDGADGMALLSRWPVDLEKVQDFSDLRWRDLPQANPPISGGRPFPSEAAQSTQRLSTVGHWVVPVMTPRGSLICLLFHATPPVFDGPEDQNGLRNADEIHLWSLLLDGIVGVPPEPPFVLMGNANLDPEKGAGRREAIRSLLADPRLQDPHAGKGPTVDWPEPEPGNLRVSYLLPSADIRVSTADVHWPDVAIPVDNPPPFVRASRHRIVWADLLF